MIKYINIIQKTKVFKNINQSETEKILNCLDVNVKKFKKGSFIYYAGDRIQSLNILAEGAIHIVKEDYWGNMSILTEIVPGDIFGETYACIDNAPLQVGVFAVKDSTVVELDIKKLISSNEINPCFHSRLVENLLYVLAEKNLMLTNKIEAITQRSIENKVLTYLSQQSVKNNSSSFYVPFNRQQLADYLSVDRSALSKELCRLRDEGLLNFNKNYFELKAQED